MCDQMGSLRYETYTKSMRVHCSLVLDGNCVEKHEPRTPKKEESKKKHERIGWEKMKKNNNAVVTYSIYVLNSIETNGT